MIAAATGLILRTRPLTETSLKSRLLNKVVPDGMALRLSLPVTRCQICQRTLAYRPGEASAVLTKHYHDKHPFHHMLHGGKLNKGQVQAWALNRYYYQSTIPLKDAVVISRFRDRGIRMEWRHRIEDHDGDVGTEGGIERWLKLTEGLDRKSVV